MNIIKISKLSKPSKKEKAALVYAKLTALYPEAKCALTYNKPHELLIAVRLSAQCTDSRVNMVTPLLFKRFPELKSFAEAEPGDVELYINSCGLGRTKARDIVLICRKLLAEYGGEIPRTIEELLMFPGVGRKTANLIAGTLYGVPAVVTDTHVLRLSYRLGLTDTKVPEKAEKELREILPPEESLGFCHRLVWYGRYICKARNPACGECGFRGNPCEAYKDISKK